MAVNIPVVPIMKIIQIAIKSTVPPLVTRSTSYMENVLVATKKHMDGGVNKKLDHPDLTVTKHRLLARNIGTRKVIATMVIAPTILKGLVVVSRHHIKNKSIL
jgi:hypothetical protein